MHFTFTLITVQAFSQVRLSKSLSIINFLKRLKEENEAHVVWCIVRRLAVTVFGGFRGRLWVLRRVGVLDASLRNIQSLSNDH